MKPNTPEAGPVDATETPAQSALSVITEQLQEAIRASKCHQCGCLQQTVKALGETDLGKNQLAGLLTQARDVFAPKKYDCLGCAVCYPAIAANAFVEAYPQAGAGLDLCPTEEPQARQGWPPLPGDYSIIRYRAPVAVCALNSASLVKALAESKPDGLAVVGTLHTENLGIERVIKNTLANPYIRFLVLCGEDTQRAVGHLPGQSLESLFRDGLDERGRILGARGKRPVLKNVTREEVQAFLQQVELVSRIGEGDAQKVSDEVRSGAARDPGPYPVPFVETPIERIQVAEPQRLTLDKAGYFVVYPDSRSQRLVVEHYTNQGVLNCVLEGTSVGAMYCEVIERRLLTRLDHAAYLGRELARAEKSLLDRTAFVQDAAPGGLTAPTPMGEESGCGCSSAAQPKGCC